MSKIWLFLAFIFIIGPLGAEPPAAEKVLSIEYHLPNEGADWKVVEEISNENKVVYIPKNSSPWWTAKEIFSVHVHYHPMNIHSQDVLEAGIKAAHPNQEVSITFLEKPPQYVLYEWIVTDVGQEKVHGWTRGFVNSRTTVFLNYQTEQIDTINSVSPAWLKTLKEAKFEK